MNANTGKAEKKKFPLLSIRKFLKRCHIKKLQKKFALFSFYGMTQCQVMLALAVILSTASHPLGISTISVGVPFWKKRTLEKEKQLYEVT